MTDGDSGRLLDSVPARFVGGPTGFRALLERLGPTWVKLGQFLALRPDILPQEYCDELMRLLDALPPFPWPEAEAIIAGDLGGDPEQLFAYVDPTPVAAGSLAQTHRAVTRDGREVAVKVQRPGVRERVMRDLRRVDAIARLLELAQASAVVVPREVAAELRSWMLQELDLRRELRNMQRLHELARDSAAIRIPRPEPDLSGARVLTAEYIHGVPFTTLLADLRADAATGRDAHGLDLDLLAENLLDAALTQIFRYRFFHADLHPGNLIALPGDAVGFVDFGLCDELEPAIREGQTRYLAALYERDVGRMHAALDDILVVGDDSDPLAFRAEFTRTTRDWLARMPAEPQGHALGAGRSPIAGWMVAAMRVARQHRMRLPPRVLSMYRALLTAESVANELGAGADLGSVGREFFGRLRSEDGFARIQRADLEAVAISAIGLLRDAPDQVHRILRETAEGRFALPVDVAEPPSRTRARRVRVRLVAAALLSVGIAAALARAEVPHLAGVDLGWLLAALLCGLYAAIAVGWSRLA